MYKFKMFEVGINLNTFLGIKVKYDQKNGVMKLNQAKYIDSLIKRTS